MIDDIFDAINTGDVNILRRVIRNGAEVNALGSNTENTPLVNAINHSSPEIVELLILYGALLGKGRFYKNSIVFLLYSREISQISKKLHLLLAYSVIKVDLVGSLQNSLLHLAVKNKKLKIAHVLIVNRANVNIKNIFDETPLHLAVLNHSFEIVKLLLRNQAIVNVTNCSGESPLYLAVKNKNLQLVKILLLYEANAKEVYQNKKSLLYLAVFNNTAKIVKMLLKYGANVELLNTDSILLHTAVFKNNPEMVKILLEHGAKVNATNLLKKHHYILRYKKITSK